MPVFIHRVFTYSPGKPRSHLLRILLGLVGVAVLVVLLAVGLFVGLGMLLFAAVRRLTRANPAKSTTNDVLDGEYTVVHKHSAPLGLH